MAALSRYTDDEFCKKYNISKSKFDRAMKAGSKSYGLSSSPSAMCRWCLKPVNKYDYLCDNCMASKMESSRKKLKEKKYEESERCNITSS